MIKIPFIKQEERLKFDSLIKNLYDLNIEKVDDIIYILFYYCKDCIEPKYNSYKNYIGELYLCANEIKERLIPNNIINSFVNTYINVNIERKLKLNKIIKLFHLYNIKVDGDLNYILYKYAKYTKTILIYEIYNALLSCILKIKEEILKPYENRKIIENGDI